MHRKHIRATVGAGDVDVPIGTFAEGQYVRLVGGILVTEALPATIVSGVPPTIDNAIARWDGTTGTLLQNSLVIISDTAQVTGVTALNGRDIARWTDGPNVGGATDSAIALWDGTTGRLLKNSVVTIDDDGDITTPGDMNPDSVGGIPVGVLVRSSQPVTHTDNSVARWDGTTGHSLDDSAVIIDDSGNVTGVSTLNTRDPARWVDGPTPAVSVHGNITVWDGTSGRLIADSGLGVANIVYNLDSEVVTGHLPEFTDSAGRRITDSGIISDHVATSPATGTDNRIARYDGNARAIQSSAVSVDDSGNITGVTTINGIDSSLWVRGPASAANANLAAFNGTSGKVIYDTGIASGLLVSYTSGAGAPGVNEIACFDSSFPITVSYRLVRIDASGNLTNVGTINGIVLSTLVTAASSFATDNRVLRSDGTGRGAQASAVSIDDSGNVSGVGTLNTRTIANFVDGPASSTDNSVARFNATSGKLIQNSVVIIDDSGNITGVGTLNGITVSNIVTAAAAFSTDNRVLRSDGTSRGAQASAVTIDDSGNITGAGTYNTVNVAAHAVRHRPGGADSLFGTSDWGDVYIHPEVAGDPMQPKYWSIGACGGSAGALTTSLRQVMNSIFVTRNRASNAFDGTIHAHAWFPYSLGDTGSDLIVQPGWSGMTATCMVTCGAQGAGSTVSGTNITLDNSNVGTNPQTIPGAGIIHVFWSASNVPQGAYVYVFMRSTGATHTLYLGGCELYEDAGN